MFVIHLWKTLQAKSEFTAIIQLYVLVYISSALPWYSMLNRLLRKYWSSM